MGFSMTTLLTALVVVGRWRFERQRPLHIAISLTTCNWPPRPPLVLPPNFRDVTAEKVGTVIGIVGATAVGKGTKPG
jgi:Tfp pilus assembly ATPase PilU